MIFLYKDLFKSIGNTYIDPTWEETSVISKEDIEIDKVRKKTIKICKGEVKSAEGEENKAKKCC